MAGKKECVAILLFVFRAENFISCLNNIRAEIFQFFTLKMWFHTKFGRKIVFCANFLLKIIFRLTFRTENNIPREISYGK